MNMLAKIEKLIEERYTYNDFYINKYDDNSIHICNAVEELLKSNSATISQYSVDCDTIFDNPGCELSYFSIAYIENGKLEHITYTLEVI